MNQTKTKKCVVCGKDYEATGKNQKYCENCRKKIKKQRQHDWIVNHKEWNAKYMQEYYRDSDNHAKHLQRLKANNQKYKGKLAIPTTCAKKGCSCTTGLHWYHVDYNNSEYPHVVALCPKCHAEEVKKNQIKNKEIEYDEADYLIF